MIVASWLAVIVAARLAERSWWSPGALLSLVLGINALGTEIFAPEYFTSFEANLALQGLCLLTVVGTVIGRSFPGRDRDRVPLEVRRVRSFVAFGLVASVLSFVLTLEAIGAGIATLFSPLELMRAAQSATRMRYVEGLDFPLTYNIANAAILVYAAIAAMHFVSTRRISTPLLVPLVIYGASNLLITTRAPLMFMLIIMVSAALFADKETSETKWFRPLFSRRSLIVATVLGVAIAGLFFFFQVLRFGETSTRSADDVWAHLRRWPWGNLPGFSLWFEGQTSEITEHTPGFYTFMGLFDNLGVEDRVQGAYREFVYLTASEPGNIYTAFRGLVHDFGWLGCALFMIGVGVMGGAAIVGRAMSPRISAAVYIAVFGFVAWSFIISFWAYTANLAAFVALPLAMRAFCGTSQKEEIRGRGVAARSIA